MLAKGTSDALWEELCESGKFDDGPFSVDDVLDRIGVTPFDKSHPGLRRAIAEFLDGVARQHADDGCEHHFQRFQDGRYSFNFVRG